MVTLRDLYIAELRDLYDAERHLLDELPGLSSKATSTTLVKLLEQHVEQTRIHVQRLGLLFEQQGMSPDGQPCEGIRGLIAEARRRLGDAERGDVLDATIIGVAQRVEHYEMAAYGCARSYAKTLGDDAAERVLQQTLDEEGDMDHRLSALAEGDINRAAGGEDAYTDMHLRSRLRYVDGKDLPEFHRRTFRVTNEDKEDLGVLDGFIVDSTSGQPRYFVIDSGGWFAGDRYVVPIGMLQADEAARTLRATLDRRTIQRYPEFSPSAFLAMNDDEARRFEDRLLAVVAPERARTGRWTRAAYEDMPEYRPPNWMQTGVWMTEGTDFAAPPPRDHREQYQEYPEAEPMMARGEQDVPDSGEVRPRDVEQPKTTDPRIERYRER